MKTFAVGVDNLGDEAAWEWLESRWWATRPVHRYSHRQKIESTLPLLDNSQSLLDITRGASVDGILGVPAARTNRSVTVPGQDLAPDASTARFAAY